MAEPERPLVRIEVGMKRRVEPKRLAPSRPALDDDVDLEAGTCPGAHRSPLAGRPSRPAASITTTDTAVSRAARPSAVRSSPEITAS